MVLDIKEKTAVEHTGFSSLSFTLRVISSQHLQQPSLEDKPYINIKLTTPSLHMKS